MGYLEGIRAVIDEFPDRVLLGEVQGGVDRIGEFYDNDRPRFHLPLNFMLLDTEWQAASLAANIDQYLNSIPDKAWPVWILGSHDKPRIASRIGIEQARVAAMLLFTLPGTPIFHAGDEIGVPNGQIPRERIRDPFEILVPGYGLNRDPERTPMRWDSSENAGFTTGEPWLPIGDEIEARNVASQAQDGRSVLGLYRRLIRLRQNEPALLSGRFEPQRSQGEVLLFERRLGHQSLRVALNTGNKEHSIELPGRCAIRLSTHLDRCGKQEGSSLCLRAAEGVVLELEVPGARN
jgi:alpha-glucosidase